MPTFSNIAVSLQSQYDALTIPEFQQLGSRLHSIAPTATAWTSFSNTTVDIIIPTLPSSQFWISYTCVPPDDDDDDVRFYYFKLCTAGKCVLSWGVGEREEWQGKTMFGLFEAGTDFEGRKVVEKRGLVFPKSNGKSGVFEAFEIRVFRARARKRDVLSFEKYRCGMGSGINFTSLGQTKKGDKQRMYKYALIDPTDEPYVTFKYICRPSDELRNRSSTTSTEEDIPQPAQSSETNLTLSRDIKQSPEGADTGESSDLSLRRLSLPPRTQLRPSTSHKEPSSPVKKEVASHTDADSSKALESSVLRHHTKRERREWILRTPSPMRPRLFDQPATSPLEQNKADPGSNGLLSNVIASAMMRKTGRGKS